MGIAVQASKHCLNLKQDGSRCCEAADPDGDHAVDCSAGGGTKLRHDGLCDLWATFAAEANASSWREVFVPEFKPAANCTKPNTEGKHDPKEAWMDIHADGTPDICDFLGDVTVCNPAACRYLAGASATCSLLLSAVHTRN